MNLPTRFTALVLLVPSVYAVAQLQVKGTIKDVASGTGIPFASVVLLKQSDSTLVAGQMSTEQGMFELTTNESGSYFLTITSAGYQKTSSAAFELSTSTSPVQISLTAAEHVNKLDEVVVRGEKPFFEQKIDRTVINVQSLISRAGGTAIDILQRSPGVTVDRMNKSISLSGKQGVRIMINGKISRIPMEAIVQMLSGINAENIERIELITTPPSRYEAEGDAGMINIVMKQSTDVGTNGSVSAFTGYGRDVKYGGNVNMNNRSKAFNFYGDINTRQDYTRMYWNTKWSTSIDDQIHELISENDRPAYDGVISGNLGAEWQAGKKLSFGGSFGVFDYSWDMDANADITKNIDNALESTIDMNTIEQNNYTQYIANLNFNYKFSDRWDATYNLDRISYDSYNPTAYQQDYFDSGGSPTGTEYVQSSKETGLIIWTSSIDITGKLSDKVSLEFGGKGSFSNLNNAIIVENYDDSQWVTDPALTVYASMFENILAGYFSTSIKATSRLDIQMGVRYEHTVTNIDTDAQQNAVDRNYGNWFPTLFFNQRINENNSFVLSYSRRISRPSFGQLAPFVIFNDPNSFYSGNIALLPSFTDAIKAEYRYKTWLVSLLYSHDKNAIAMFQPEINDDNKQVSASQNLDYRQSLGMVVTFPIQFTKWWELQVNAAGGISKVRANYLESPIDLKLNNYSVNAIQKFNVAKSISAEITAYYGSKQYWGVMEFGSIAGVDVGLEKRFKNSNLRLSCADIFQTVDWKFNTYIESQNLKSSMLVDWETTAFYATYTLNFGNGILRGANKRTGSSEELNRLRN